MSELFLLLDQLLGLAWIFPTLHRNHVSIQRPQKHCLRKQLRAARRQSASLTIAHSNRRAATFKPLSPYTHTSPEPCPPPTTDLLHLLYCALCLTQLPPSPRTKDTQKTDARNVACLETRLHSHAHRTRIFLTSDNDSLSTTSLLDTTLPAGSPLPLSPPCAKGPIVSFTHLQTPARRYTKHSCLAHARPLTVTPSAPPPSPWTQPLHFHRPHARATAASLDASRPPTGASLRLPLHFLNSTHDQVRLEYRSNAASRSSHVNRL